MFQTAASSPKLRANQKLQLKMLLLAALGLSLFIAGFEIGPRLVTRAPYISIALFFVFLAGGIIWIGALLWACVLVLRARRLVSDRREDAPTPIPPTLGATHPKPGMSQVGLDSDPETVELQHRSNRRRTALTEIGAGVLLVALTPDVVLLLQNPATRTPGGYGATGVLIGLLLLVHGTWMGRQFAPDHLEVGVSGLELIERRILGSGERRHASEWDELTLSPREPSGWGSLTFGRAIFDFANPFEPSRNAQFDRLRIPPSVYDRLAPHVPIARASPDGQ
jgi:hypothetical protein